MPPKSSIEKSGLVIPETCFRVDETPKRLIAATFLRKDTVLGFVESKRIDSDHNPADDQSMEGSREGSQQDSLSIVLNFAENSYLRYAISSDKKSVESNCEICVLYVPEIGIPDSFAYAKLTKDVTAGQAITYIAPTDRTRNKKGSAGTTSSSAIRVVVPNYDIKKAPELRDITEVEKIFEKSITPSREDVHTLRDYALCWIQRLNRNRSILETGDLITSTKFVLSLYGQALKEGLPGQPLEDKVFVVLGRSLRIEMEPWLQAMGAKTQMLFTKSVHRVIVPEEMPDSRDNDRFQQAVDMGLQWRTAADFRAEMIGAGSAPKTHALRSRSLCRYFPRLDDTPLPRHRFFPDHDVDDKEYITHQVYVSQLLIPYLHARNTHLRIIVVSFFKLCEESEAVGLGPNKDIEQLSNVLQVCLHETTGSLERACQTNDLADYRHLLLEKLSELKTCQDMLLNWHVLQLNQDAIQRQLPRQPIQSANHNTFTSLLNGLRVFAGYYINFNMPSNPQSANDTYLRRGF